MGTEGASNDGADRSGDGADRSETSVGETTRENVDRAMSDARDQAPANENAAPTAEDYAASQERLAAEGQQAKERFEQQAVEVDAPDPEAIAEDIIADNTRTQNARRGQDPVTTTDMQGVAADIVDVARTDPALGGDVYNAASEMVDAEQLEAAVNAELQKEHLADAALLGDATPEPVDMAEASAMATDLIEAHTHTHGTRAGTTRTTFDVNSLAYDIEQLAETNPSMAVAVRTEVAAQLNGAQASDLNRIVSGDATIAENIEIALENPIDGIIGAGKGIVNGFSAVAEIFARGSAMEAAGHQYQAAGYASLFGNDERAAEHIELAEGMHDAAMNEDFVPEFAIDNRAQQGGETIGFAIDVAMAGKGIITGGARMLAGSADELAELGARQLDEVAGAADNIADDMIRLGDDVPNRTQTRTAPNQADLDPDDIERFGYNHEQGRPDMAEGVGTARANEVIDGEFRLPGDDDLGVDFYVDDVPVSLKGPLINSATGDAIQIRDGMVDGLANSVLKDMRINTATDTIVVDTMNMSPLQRERLRNAIEEGVAAMENGGKNVIYLE
ncbi:MAG: hypothetical protein AAGG57_17640 [Pseudomonadota bacterium]